MRKQLVYDKIKHFDNESTILAKEIAQNADDSTLLLKELYDKYCDKKDHQKQLKENYKKMKGVLDSEEIMIRQKRDTI